MLLPVVDFANHPAYGPSAALITQAERAQALEKYGRILDQVRRKYAPYQFAWGSPARLGNPSHSPIYDDLVRDGIVGLSLPADLKARVRAIAGPYVAALRDKLAAGPGEKGANAQTRLEYNDFLKTELGDLLRLLLRTYDIMPIVSAYLGLPKVALKLVHYKITTPGVSRARGVLEVFPDGCVADPATRYMHVDAAACDLKIIIYLSDVTDGAHGPFSYVPGTHGAPYLSLEEFAVRAAATEFAARRSADARRLLMCLPEMYRQRIDFGSDLDPATPVARDLLARERTFLSGDADMILFDSKGIHRGAMVTEGERVIMQATFQGMVD